MENENSNKQDNIETENTGTKLSEINEVFKPKSIHNKNNIEILAIALLIATLFIIVLNVTQLNQLKSDNLITGMAISSINTYNNNPIATSNDKSSNNLASGIDIVPKGIPEIYGKEIGISFDDVSENNPQKADQTIKKIGSLDNQISLSGGDKERYISIAGKISCEYCCGVESIIEKDGKPACGCAHSYAMRGLAKYLIKNHKNEYTDEQILEELGKWKTMFFPAQISKKAVILKEKGIELNYINLASNKYRGIETSDSTATATSAKVDTTGWTDDEKMMYEHHGLLPTRVQGS